jgi:hypothetical protein
MLGAALVAGCAQPATAIVVVVDSDIPVPDELALVHAEVGGAACASASCAHDFPLTGADAVALPFSFTVTPAGSGGPLALALGGRDARSRERVSRTVSTSFVTGRTVVLRVFLSRSCVDHDPCGAGTTCIGGRCAADAVDPASLAPLVPGTELDGGPIDDAGRTRDAGIDAGIDSGDGAAIDSGIVPRSCAEVSAGASGAFVIDPDGAGGRAPFLAYCELSAAGGGWTLLAKIAPTGSTLGYDAGAWMLGAPAPLGTPDMTAADALLDGYWSLPVSQVRVVMGASAPDRELVTDLVPATPTTLRAAMDSRVALSATAIDWATLVGASGRPAPTLPATCEASGVPAALPSSAPSLRVRIGYVWSDDTTCGADFWAGAGASGIGTRSSGGCHAVASAGGGGRLCGNGVTTQDYPRAVWVFGR